MPVQDMYKLIRFCASLHHVGQWTLKCLPWAWVHCGIGAVPAGFVAEVEHGLYEFLLERCNALELSSRRLNPFYLAVTSVYKAVVERVGERRPSNVEPSIAEEAVRKALHATLFHISTTAQGMRSRAGRTCTQEPTADRNNGVGMPLNVMGGDCRTHFRANQLHAAGLYGSGHVQSHDDVHK